MSADLAAARLTALAAGSRTLALFAQEDPRVGALLTDEGPLPSDYEPPIAEAYRAGGPSALRLEKRRRLLQIAARDLAGECGLEEVGRALADLASACLEVALQASGEPDALAVIGMGKLGGRELNYSSDIDLMFVAGPDLESANRAATSLVGLLGEFSSEGQAYRIDLNLRPEGRSGPLVRTLDSYLEYYRRWSEVWEHQALLKARHVAGDLGSGAAFVEATRPFVFASEVNEERVAAIRRMKERVEGHAQRNARRAKTNDQSDVKLGPGGIRDIEFSIQLFQLVHGAGDPNVRQAGTLDALHALVERGYIADEDGAGLNVAYRWLRNVEHRLQLWQERQTHRLPDDGDALTLIARSLGFQDSPAASAGQRFMERHRMVLADVRSRFEKLFYRPMIQALAEPGDPGLASDALRERLVVLGFRDVERAARTLQELVTGTSRRAKLLRILTPAMLRFLSSAPQPDTGLFNFLRLGEALDARLDVLGALRDNPPAIALLARVLGSGRFLGEVIAHVPEEIATIADSKRSEGHKTRDQLVKEARASISWRGPERLLEGLRRFKRREMLRVALADIANEAGVEDVGRALSDLAEACLEGGLQDSEIPFSVIGMGKLGGRELSYASDIDVMFVFDGPADRGEETASKLMRAIGEVTPEGQAFRIDAGLRPEGKSGVLARSLPSYFEYYGRWSEPWEHLALIKSRVVAGDDELGEAFLQGTRQLPFPDRMTTEALRQIRHLKVRMEKERIPRGSDPRRHVKLGPGGLSDIEFAVQITQMRFGGRHEELRVVGTTEALAAAQRVGLVSETEARNLEDAYRFASRLRDRMFFMYARPSDSLPAKPEEVESLGIAMGFEEQPRQELEEAYLRVTRRARKVCERLIYGENS